MNLVALGDISFRREGQRRQKNFKLALSSLHSKKSEFREEGVYDIIVLRIL